MFADMARTVNRPGTEVHPRELRQRCYEAVVSTGIGRAARAATAEGFDALERLSRESSSKPAQEVGAGSAGTPHFGQAAAFMRSITVKWWSTSIEEPPPYTCLGVVPRSFAFVTVGDASQDPADIRVLERQPP